MAIYKLIDGNPVVVPIKKMGEPFTVGAAPGSGDSVNVEFSLGGTAWYAWDAGAVTVPTLRTVRSAVSAVRFTRASGSGNQSVGELL